MCLAEKDVWPLPYLNGQRGTTTWKILTCQDHGVALLSFTMFTGETHYKYAMG